MRLSRRLDDVKDTVLVLGAGASAADGAPVISTYLREIERCFGHRREWHLVAEVLNTYTNQHNYTGAYPPLNDFLTYLDEHIALGKCIGDHHPQDIRFRLLKLAFGCLTEQERPRKRFEWASHADAVPFEVPAYRETCDHSHDAFNDRSCADIAPPEYDITRAPRTPDYAGITYSWSQYNNRCIYSGPVKVDSHDRAVATSSVEKSVQPKPANTPANHRLAEWVKAEGIKTVISTNYDLIFDQAAEDSGMTVDYQVDKCETEDANNCMTLLKLHGSVNWLACLHCGHIRVWPDSYPTQALWSEARIGERCQRCGLREWEDTLVTPSRMRLQESEYPGSVWGVASDALNSASCVMFIGYSLPEEDEDVVGLLKEGIPRRTPVIVVDPSLETINRYEKLFGSFRAHAINDCLTPHLWDSAEVRSFIDEIRRFYA
jgi:NAD-dependent SIR2 family protein deacetylase